MLNDPPAILKPLLPVLAFTLSCLVPPFERMESDRVEGLMVRRCRHTTAGRDQEASREKARQTSGLSAGKRRIRAAREG